MRTRRQTGALGWALATLWLSVPSMANAAAGSAGEGAGERAELEARASDDAEGHASVALLAGYGLASTLEVLGPGGGIRAGYTLSQIYVGAEGVFHLGSSDPGEDNVRHHAQSVRLELGYEFHAGAAVLRPSLRPGVALITTPRDRRGHFYSPEIALGATAFVPFGNLFAGVDLDLRYETEVVQNGDVQFGISGASGYLTFGALL